MPDNDVRNNNNPRLMAFLDLITISAQIANVEGVWIIRQSKDTSLIFVTNKQLSHIPGLSDLGQMLELDDSEMLVILRFPTGDGGEPGIEYH